jgi:hypothetical protein
VRSLKNCLNQTDCQRLFSIEDDTYIDLPNIVELFKDLESRSDPLHESLILGHCILHNNEKTYLPGIVGILLSRRAAEIVLLHLHMSVGNSSDVHIVKYFYSK